MSQLHPKYRADIDGLRAVAVLSVVAYHAFPGYVSGGFIGVDVFFVISGFLISTIIFKNIQLGTFDFIDFYSRRVKRIFPSLSVVLLTCAIAGWIFLLPEEYAQLGKHIFSGSAFFGNFTLLSESGYFDSASELKPLLHLWSLGVEEQFYIFWPLIIVFGWKFRVNLYLIIGVSLVSSFAMCVWYTNVDVATAFFSPHTRFWEMLIGAFLAKYLLIERKRFSPIVASSLSGAGIILLFAGVVFLKQSAQFPGWIALIPTVGVVGVISGGETALINRVLLSNRVAVFIGLISYPLYLWHWPILSFLRIVEGGKPSAEYRLLAVICALGLAWGTYALIEKPIRFKMKNRRALELLIFLMLLIGGLGLSIFIYDGYKNRQALQDITATKQVLDQLVGSKWQYTKDSECTKRYGQFYEDGDTSSWNFCMQSSANEPTLLLLGNSHANQLYPGFIRNVHLAHHSVLSIGSFNAAGYEPQNTALASSIERERIAINKIIATTASIKYVIIGGVDEVPNDEYYLRLHNRIEIIESLGKIVIIFSPHIKPTFHPKYCFTRPHMLRSKDCIVGIDSLNLLSEKFDTFSKVVKSQFPKVLFFNQNEMFCIEGRCSIVRDGLPLHRDDNHLSEFGSLMVAEYFVKWARVNLPAIIDSSSLLVR